MARSTPHSVRRSHAGNLYIVTRFCAFMFPWIDERINFRAQIEDGIARCLRKDAVGDYIMVAISERDCDHVYVQYSRRFDNPTVRTLLDLEAELGRNAEGPFSWYIVDAQSDVPENEEHDYIAEAYEDGHPYSVGY